MFALLFSVLAVGVYDETEPAPKSPPPYVLIGTVKDEVFVTKIAQTAVVPVTVTEKAVQGDKVVEVTHTKYRIETTEIEMRRDLKRAKVHTVGGQKLSLQDVQKRLAKAQVVVVSADGRPIAAAYLKLFDKDALVIVPQPGIEPPQPNFTPPPPLLPKK